MWFCTLRRFFTRKEADMGPKSDSSMEDVARYGTVHPIPSVSNC